MEKQDRRVGKSKLGVSKARLAFLYGVNGSDPVTTTKELCAIAGVNEVTLGKHVVKWKEEAEEIAKKQYESQNVSALSVKSFNLSPQSAVFEDSKKDIETLRTQVDLYASQLENITSCTKLLHDFMSNFDDDREHALKCFENYINGVGSRATLLSNFLKAKTAWDKACGLDAYTDIQVSGAKVVASIQAKASVSDDKTEQLESDSLKVGFKRRG